jgi:hypothetical protein
MIYRHDNLPISIYRDVVEKRDINLQYCIHPFFNDKFKSGV